MPGWTCLGVLALVMLPIGARAPSMHTLDGRTLTAAAIDADVTKLMRDDGVAGLGLTLIQHGQVAYSRAYGFAIWPLDGL